jgi:low affinity Fe/Cu permease
MFNRFAEAVANQVASAWFFTLCCLLILVWAPSLPLFGSVDTWQLIINTVTTIITFLLVALLHNDQQLSEARVQKKLDTIVAQNDAILEQNADIVDELEKRPTADELLGQLVRQIRSR